MSTPSGMDREEMARTPPSGTRRERRQALAKRPGQYHHGDLRRALLEAARGLLEREGPLGVCLRAAARRARVSQTAPYRHFADKEALLAALAAEGLGELAGRMAAAARSESSPLASLRAIGVAYARTAAENPHLFRLMFGPEAADKERYPAVREAGASAYQVLLDTITACQWAGAVRRGDPEDLALAAWSAVHGLSCLIVDGRLAEKAIGRGDAAAAAARVMQEMMAGLAPR